MNLNQCGRIAIRSQLIRLTFAIIPLATLTVAARASTVAFNPGICDNVYGRKGTCTIAILPLGGNPDANHVEAYTQNNYNSQYLSASGDREIELNYSGSATGSFDTPETIPISWDFDIITTKKKTDVSWNLLFEITTTGSPYTEMFSGSVDDALSGEEVFGSSFFSGVVGTVTGWEIQLTLTSAAKADKFSLDIPGGATLDINPVTPEPTSFLLAGAGIAGLLWFKKKQSKQSS